MKKITTLQWLSRQNLWSFFKTPALQKGLRLTVIGILVIILLQSVLVGFNGLRHNNPILGLLLENKLVGWPTIDFRSQIDAVVTQYENRGMLVKAGNVTNTVTLRQLGVSTSKQQIQTNLLAAGRTGSALHQVLSQNKAVFGGYNVSLGQPAINADLARAYVASLGQKIDVAPTNAYLAYENQVVVRPDSPGQTIDTDTATSMLSRANPLRDNELTLPIKQTIATVTAPMLERLLPQAQAIAQKPLNIAASSSQVALMPEQLVSLLVPKVAPNPDDANQLMANLTFDEAKLNAAVDEVIKKAAIAPQPTIMNGDQVVQQGKNGLQAKDSHSVAHVLQALLQRQNGLGSPDVALIPMVEVSPPVIQQRTIPAHTRTGTGLVRLTFDDGPGGHTDQILDILGRYNVHGTFYVIGRNVPRYTAQMQRTKNEGHKICNHSFSHANLTQLSRAGVVEELSATQAAIQQATGVTPNCFRPPYGAHNATVRDAAASLGLSLDMWSVDPRDWAQPGSGAIRQRVLSGVGSGGVVLLHVLNQQTVDALPGIIEGIRAQGYTLE